MRVGLIIVEKSTMMGLTFFIGGADYEEAEDGYYDQNDICRRMQVLSGQLPAEKSERRYDSALSAKLRPVLSVL